MTPNECRQLVGFPLLSSARRALYDMWVLGGKQLKPCLIVFQL